MGTIDPIYSISAEPSLYEVVFWYLVHRTNFGWCKSARAALAISWRICEEGLVRIDPHLQLGDRRCEVACEGYV